MTIINTSPDRTIQIGYEGEDRVTVLRFRYGADWLENGEGIFHIRVRRHGENTAYNAALVADDAENNCLLMTVTNVELSVKGAGEMQVVYSGENFVKKSPIYSYNVSRAVDEAVDPPAQDVYTQIIESLSELGEDIGDIQTDIRLIEGNIGNLADLTTDSKTDLVSAINEVNEHGGGSVTVDSELSTTSKNPVQNKVITARINGLDSDVGTLRTSVQSKADTATVSALSDAVNGLDSDVQGLQTAVQSKVEDVQINGTSIVTDGVAEMPIANVNNKFGVIRYHADYGLRSVLNTLAINAASLARIRAGTNDMTPIAPSNQHESAFYGLAKVAGYDEKNSTLPVGQYSEEAKTAIRTMLGLQEMYEWYKNQT